MRRTTLVTLALCLVLACVPPASAQQCEGRPGASAIDQYCEAIPEATGDQRPGNGTSGSRTSTTRETVGVSPQTESTLRGAGDEGAQVLALTESGSGGEKNVRESESRRSTTSTTAVAGVSAASPPSNNPLKAVSSAVSSGQTVGSGFVWLLLGLTLAIVALGWMRYRGGRSADSSE